VSVLSVGVGKQYASIAAAVTASASGDTIEVQAGTYTNDWLSIDHDLNLVAVGGWVRMVASNAQPPDGKAMITEQGNVSISGFDISGVTVPDANGAAIRYQGGNLVLDNVSLHDNQDGLLGAADASGSISINNSEIAFNGDGSGHTHGLYIGQIATFTLTNSYVHDTSVGHEIKSRANSNTITGNRIFDNASTSSYSIDLPNAGNATISGNIIEQGAATQNPAIFAYGEEGASNAGRTVEIRDNTIVNDSPGGYLLLNPGGFSVGYSGGTVFGLTQAGMVQVARPILDLAPIGFLGQQPPPSPPPPAEPPPPPSEPTPSPEIPPPSPTPVLTPLEQYHADVLADFQVWAATHIKLATMDRALAVLHTELNSTTVLGIIKGDRWSV
jgi:hypothetical protein